MEDEDDAFLQVEDFLEDVSIACEVPVPNCSEIHILAVIHALFYGFAIRANFKKNYRSARAIAELSTHLTLHPIPFCQEFSKILPVSLKVPPPPSDLTLALG